MRNAARRRASRAAHAAWRRPRTPGAVPFPHAHTRAVCPSARAGIEDLREKREEVNRSIAKDEEEKGASRPTGRRASRGPALTLRSARAAKIQNDLRILTERLARINDNLARKVSSRTEYDKTITETEAAYSKIMESSQTLLHVLKRESVNLTKKKQASS